MDRNLKRRAQRNFTKLLKLLVSVTFFAALAAAVHARFELISGRPLVWAVVPALMATALIALYAVVQQARRIRSFIPVREAASLWWAGTRRRLKSGRALTTPEAGAVSLMIVVFFTPMVLLLGPSHDWVVPPARSIWPGVALFGLACLLLYPLVRKGSAGVAAPRWFPALGAAALALFPVVTIGVIADRRAEARRFADGPVHRETVFARIEGPCLPARVKPWRRRSLCATASTSRGPIRRWTIRVDRDAYHLQRRVGTMCLRVPLEWAADNSIRVAGGMRRYRAGDLIRCPPGLPRIARLT